MDFMFLWFCTLFYHYNIIASRFQDRLINELIHTCYCYAHKFVLLQIFQPMEENK